MRVAILGFGLIGGSVARALAIADRAWSVAAWSPTGEGPRRAHQEGILTADPATPEATIEGADLVLLAGPPLACLEMVDRLAGPWSAALRPEAVVSDVASTKAAIVGRATDRGLRFVGGHPMAGVERSGYGAATAQLFVERPWVVVPTDPADGDALGRVTALAEACRARPIPLAAAEHDAAVAAISHLPLVVSAALVEAIAGPDADGAPDGWPLAARLAAGGWHGATRLARGDPAMGAGILATNGPAVATRLRDLRAALDAWLAQLEDPATEPSALEARLRSARDRLMAGD